MAHYDSVATGPGASDNGSGVVTLPETLRALRVGPSLRNDAILAFTDGEEDGGLGARAFVDEYSPAKLVSVDLVDSGGSCGQGPLVAEASISRTDGWFGRWPKHFDVLSPPPFPTIFAEQSAVETT
jgi:Zn-dependent M28 family amino/carboxypeptidase